MTDIPTHAIIVIVRFKPGLEESANEMLNSQVIPGAKSAAGFVGGYWMHSADGATGTSVELFDSLANAEAELAKRSMEMPPESPVTIDSVAVMEVVGTA